MHQYSLHEPYFFRSLLSPEGRGLRRATHVRTLTITISAPIDELTATLQLCRNLTKVALWHDELTPDILSPLCTGPLQLFSTWLEVLEVLSDCMATRPDLTFSWFPRLTHLHVMVLNSRWRPWQFHKLPALTHIALDYDYEEDIIEDFVKNILLSCKQLKMLAIVSRRGRGFDLPLVGTWKAGSISDKRLVFIDDRGRGAMTEWMAEVGGAPGIWTDAEEALRTNAVKARSQGVPNVPYQLNAAV